MDKNSEKQKNDKPEFIKVDLPDTNTDTKKKSGKKTVQKKKTIVADQKKMDEELDREEEKIKNELNEIYRNSDGSMPNMSDFRKKRRSSLLTAFFTLIFACLFLGTVAWVGFFVFQPQSQFAEEDVILSISGNESLQSGEEVQYRIRYRNAQNIPLVNVLLQVRYPEGFEFVDSSRDPSNEQKDEWILSSLGEHESGYIDIYGKMYGDVGKRQSFRVFLNYIPINFSSEFQKVASLNTEIIPLQDKIFVDGPEAVLLGSAVEFTFTIPKPESGLQNVALLIEPLGNFTKVSAEPDFDKDTPFQWDFPELKTEQIIKMKGIFKSVSDNGITGFNLKLVGWKDDNHQVEPYVYIADAYELKVLDSALSANLAVNGSVSDMSVQPGETLNTSIVLKNTGSTPLKNFSVKLIYETPSFDNLSMLDWKQIIDEADGDIQGEQINPSTRRGVITWDKRHIKELSQLDPGEEKTIDLQIPLKDSEDLDLTQFTTFVGSAGLEVKYEDGGNQKLLSGNQINMTINSDINFEMRDNVEINNNKEKHVITWLISNSYHELQDLQLAVDLYGDITWLEDLLQVPAGEAKFDSQEKKLIWQVPTMPTSVDVLALQFGFELNSKNPSQTNLTSKVNIKMKDAVTGQEIIKAGEAILLYATSSLGGEDEN